MKTKSKTNKLSFAQLPREYAALCRVYLPRPIRDEADFADTLEVTDAMAVHHSHFSSDQQDYFDLLCSIIKGYEDAHVKWPHRTARQRLAYLLEVNHLNGADLSRILGASRNHGTAILRGEREITAEHARVLGKHFAMPAGSFIE
jgi:antitoxin component HigA of HigAB toxin-antitoxin module